MIGRLARCVAGRARTALRDAAGERAERFAFLGLGSNLGDRLEHLQRAVDLLHADPRTRVDAVSSVYETAPVGGPEQGPYLNLAARVATTRSPRRLLALCHQVEDALGRVRTVRWGPRTVDVDILLYGEEVLAGPDLVVPHPRLHQRAFALIPLMEVAPGQVLPAAGGRPATSIPSVLARLAPVEGITMVGAQVQAPAPIASAATGTEDR